MTEKFYACLIIRQIIYFFQHSFIDVIIKKKSVNEILFYFHINILFFSCIHSYYYSTIPESKNKIWMRNYLRISPGTLENLLFYINCLRQEEGLSPKRCL